MITHSTHPDYLNTPLSTEHKNQLNKAIAELTKDIGDDPLYNPLRGKTHFHTWNLSEHGGAFSDHLGGLLWSSGDSLKEQIHRRLLDRNLETIIDHYLANIPKTGKAHEQLKDTLDLLSNDFHGFMNNIEQQHEDTLQKQYERYGVGNRDRPYFGDYFYDSLPEDIFVREYTNGYLRNKLFRNLDKYLFKDYWDVPDQEKQKEENKKHYKNVLHKGILHYLHDKALEHSSKPVYGEWESKSSEDDSLEHHLLLDEFKDKDLIGKLRDYAKEQFPVKIASEKKNMKLYNVSDKGFLYYLNRKDNNNAS